jgi:hypothetical protein
MRTVNADQLDRLAGRRLGEGDTFCFRCHRDLACFNRCCRNLRLFLYPYDLARLRSALAISSDELLDRHVDMVLRPGSFFPDVLLRMADNEEKTCPFLTEDGCRVYPDRPDTCRTFPLEGAKRYGPDAGDGETVFFYRPPHFCLGRQESRLWTVSQWARDQEARAYHEMTAAWADVKFLFRNDPWGAEGPNGPRAKMAFMAAYNIDRFRDFVFHSTFAKRYRIPSAVLRKMKTDDRALLKLGFEWIRFFLWGIDGKVLKR